MQYFHAHVDHVSHEECHVLNEQIVCDESVLANLDHNCDPVFYKISLVVEGDRPPSSSLGLDFPLFGL